MTHRFSSRTVGEPEKRNENVSAAESPGDPSPRVCTAEVGCNFVTGLDRFRI